MASGKEKASVPRIRFSGFADDWEQRKLSDMFEYGGSGGTPTASNPSYYGGTIPFLGIADIVGRDITATAKTITSEGLRSSAAWIVPTGAISLAMYASVGKVGIIRQNTATSQAFYNMVFSNDKLRDFIFSRLEKADSACEWEPFISTGTQRNLNADKVRNFDLLVPSQREVALVGTLFKAIDNLITLHQRKCECLKTVKKSLLEKMFPREGESVPKVRFSGFADDWEQRKLVDYADIIGGGTPNTSDPKFWDGDIDWYTPAEIGGCISAPKSVRRITDEGYKACSAKMLPANRTILFTSRAGIGNMAILRSSACTNQGFQSIVVHEGADVYFLFSQGGRIKTWAERHASGSTFLEISGKQLAMAPISVPTFREQRTIGSFFSDLDDLITLHQRKLELLKNIKKSLLEGMFV